MIDTIECVTKDSTSPSFILNELFFFLLHYEKKNKMNEIWGNEFLHKRNLYTSTSF